MLPEKSRILAYLRSRKAGEAHHPRLTLAALGATFFAMVAAFANVADGIDVSVPQQSVVEQLPLSAALPVDSIEGQFVREEKVRAGDSAATLLSRLGLDNSDLIDAARSNPAAQPLFRQLSPGKTVTAYMNRDGQLQSLIFPLNEKQDQALVLDAKNEALQVSQQALPVESRVVVKSADISYSLFGATDDAGIPDSVANQLVDIFGGDIDFHRDLRKGDHFSVAYESFSYLGKPLRTGRILAAEFVNDGHSVKAVWFQGADGQGGYYTPDGKSLRKAFLRSPLEFSRVTSGFSLARFHPILQKWRAHKGVDYGAPIGTHVEATGDAIVDFVGIQNGYGKVVVLQHQGPYTTLYGHLSGFAPGIHKGSRIVQGDLIGYVGQTGLASGPHLHYEFRIAGVFKNPLSIALPGSPPLSNEWLAHFRVESSAWLSSIDSIRNIRLASVE